MYLPTLIPLHGNGLRSPGPLFPLPHLRLPNFVPSFMADLGSPLILLFPLMPQFLPLIPRVGSIVTDTPVSPSFPVSVITPLLPVTFKPPVGNPLVVPPMPIPVMIPIVFSPVRVHIIIEGRDLAIMGPASVVIA